MVVAVEGSIGAGKTTTATLVAARTGRSLILENLEEHPFINDFYSDPRKYGLETELAFILLHYHSLHCAGTGDVITDFAPAKNLVFGGTYLSDHEFSVVRGLSAELVDGLAPDLAVFLDVPTAELLRRIVARGRPFEAGISHQYLDVLRQAYLSNLASLGNRVVSISVNAGDTEAEVADRVMALL